MKFQKAYRIPLYDTDLFVIVSQSLQADIEKCGHHLLKCKTPVECPRPPRGICLFGNERGNAILGFPSQTITPGLIAHESFHLCMKLLAWKQCNLNSVSDEQGAILIAWLVDTICSDTKKFHVKVPDYDSIYK